MNIYIGDPTTGEWEAIGTLKDKPVITTGESSQLLSRQVSDKLTVSMQITYVDPYAFLLFAAVAHAWAHRS